MYMYVYIYIYTLYIYTYIYWMFATPWGKTLATFAKLVTGGYLCHSSQSNLYWKLHFTLRRTIRFSWTICWTRNSMGRNILVFWTIEIAVFFKCHLHCFPKAACFHSVQLDTDRKHTRPPHHPCQRAIITETSRQHHLHSGKTTQENPCRTLLAVRGGPTTWDGLKWISEVSRICIVAWRWNVTVHLISILYLDTIAIGHLDGWSWLNFNDGNCRSETSECGCPLNAAPENDSKTVQNTAVFCCGPSYMWMMRYDQRNLPWSISVSQSIPASSYGGLILYCIPKKRWKCEYDRHICGFLGVRFGQKHGCCCSLLNWIIFHFSIRNQMFTAEIPCLLLKSPFFLVQSALVCAFASNREIPVGGRWWRVNPHSWGTLQSLLAGKNVGQILFEIPVPSGKLT